MLKGIQMKFLEYLGKLQNIKTIFNPNSQIKGSSTE